MWWFGLRSTSCARCSAARLHVGACGVEVWCHVSHKWLFHVDACAGSVLAPHDIVVNLQKRLTSVSLETECAAFVEHSWSHSWNTAKPAAPQKPRGRGHNTCVTALLVGLKFADPAVTTEPRGPTEATSKLADIFTTACPSQYAARPSTCDLRRPMQRLEMPCMQHLREKWHTTAEKSSHFANKASFTGP